MNQARESKKDIVVRHNKGLSQTEVNFEKNEPEKYTYLQTEGFSLAQVHTVRHTKIFFRVESFDLYVPNF